MNASTWAWRYRHRNLRLVFSLLLSDLHSPVDDLDMAFCSDRSKHVDSVVRIYGWQTADLPQASLCVVLYGHTFSKKNPKPYPSPC